MTPEGHSGGQLVGLGGWSSPVLKRLVVGGAAAASPQGPFEGFCHPRDRRPTRHPRGIWFCFVLFWF